MVKMVTTLTFSDINVSYGSVATYARNGWIVDTTLLQIYQ